jgi:phosphoribosylformylglycinamidine (FGAM) synthase PurS component
MVILSFPEKPAKSDADTRVTQMAARKLINTIIHRQRSVG